MNCPGCAIPMTRLALEGRLGTTIEIDMCTACRAIWFDRFEDFRLTPGATLKIFGVISEPPGGPIAPFPIAPHCPRCNAPLLLTHDIQRNTRFQYLRCDGGHGRLMTFVDFLREKDFVRPLTPPQLESCGRTSRRSTVPTAVRRSTWSKDSVWGTAARRCRCSICSR